MSFNITEDDVFEKYIKIWRIFENFKNFHLIPLRIHNKKLQKLK